MTAEHLQTILFLLAAILLLAIAVLAYLENRTNALYDSVEKQAQAKDTVRLSYIEKLGMNLLYNDKTKRFGIMFAGKLVAPGKSVREAIDEARRAL